MDGHERSSTLDRCSGVDTWEQQGRWIPTSSVDQYAATMLGFV
jgi:hypothetical protein